MILTIEELRKFVNTDTDDLVLTEKLRAIELLIRAYTNNNFHLRSFRAVAVAVSEGGYLLCKEPIPFRAGDTLQITDSDLMQGELVTVQAVENGKVIVSEELYDESGIIITKVKYPSDVKMGVANMLKWELDNRDKVGVASESISRHSVTYFNMDGDNTVMGFPKSLLGFLNPYKKARFGGGIQL